jgi:hypothetical protein
MGWCSSWIMNDGFSFSVLLVFITKIDFSFYFI